MNMVYFKKIAAVGKYHDDQAIPDVVAYITRKDKTPSRIILGYHVDMLEALWKVFPYSTSSLYPDFPSCRCQPDSFNSA